MSLPGEKPKPNVPKEKVVPPPAPTPKKAGRPAGTKNIESPEELMAFFEMYLSDTKSKPYLVVDWVGKDANEVQRQKERPLTMEGFNVFVYKHGIINNLKQYFANTENRYEDYQTVCSHIREQIRADQIEGGMAGMYNPSITQRLNGLVERSTVIVNKVGKDAADEIYE